jgi:acylphosphatase
MKKSVRLYVSGFIQGIFYRSYIKDNAERLNVKGFVRSLEDNRVEVFLEGNLDDVNKMIELCRKGLKSTEIRDIEIKDERFQDFKNFQILKI